VIRRVFFAGYVLVMSVERVRVKIVFAYICFNLILLATLARDSWRELSTTSGREEKTAVEGAS
jgi:hypothetical protein